MVAIYSILLLLLSLSILFVDNTKRICAIIIGIACFNGATFGPFTSQQLISLCCFFSLLLEYRNFVRIKNKINDVGLGGIIAIMVISFVFLAFNAPYREGVIGFLSLMFKEWICGYFFIFYGILCAKDKDIDYSSIIRVCMLCLLLLTVFGIVNFITRQSVFVNMFLLNDSLGSRENMYTNSDRFRVQSMFQNPFDYGYVCVLFSLLLWHMRQSGYLKRNTFLMGAFCAIFGVLLCNCRTIIFVFALAIACYIMLVENVFTKLKYLIASVIGFLVIAAIFPSASKYIDYIMSIFDDNSNVGGSSMEMRDMQYATVLYYIKDDMWLGLGENYYFQNFWTKGHGTTDLLGLEGVHLAYLLERGVIGLVFYVVYYALLIKKSLNLRKTNKQVSGLLVSVIVAYLSFAVMTGELSSLIPTLFLTGVLLSVSSKSIYLPLNE